MYSYPVPDTSGDGLLFSFDQFLCFFVCLYRCFFVSKIMRKRLDWFAWNFPGTCGVTMGRPDSILGQIGETARCCNANFFVSNITSKPLNRFAWNFQGRCGVTMGWPDYIFGQFRETARCRDAQHTDGVCCAFAPQFVEYSYYFIIDVVLIYYFLYCFDNVGWVSGRAPAV